MRNVTIILIISLILFSNAVAQRPNFNGNSGAQISGQVLDLDTGHPIEFANIVLLSSSDTSQIAGTVTDIDGNYVLPKIKSGSYFLKASFIGFNNQIISDINVTSNDRFIELDPIKLKATAYQLESAEVIAAKSAVEYKIDKKVINVSEQATSISGTAVEVLENVPSVNVDIEGNVSLRGSTSFTLLIDGKPTIMDANDLLQQIPASTIENIEIVTNPSAKHDPEGVSGIINVVTKKNQLVGMSGVINAHIGSDNKSGTDFVANYKNDGTTYYVGADYRNDQYPGSGIEERRTYNDDFISYLNNTNTRNFNRKGYNLKAGADFEISDQDQLSLSLTYGDYDFNSNRTIYFHEFTDPATIDINYQNLNKGVRGGDRFSTNLTYKRLFTKKNHELSASLDYQKRNGDDTSINEYFDEFGNLSSGRKNIEGGPSDRMRLKFDYTLPFSTASTFELGGQSDIRTSTENTKSFIFDTANNYFILQKDYSYSVNYKDNIHSVYSIYKNNIDNFGYQIGLRGEYTDRNIEIPDSNMQSKIQRWDYFPTIHTSYKINELVQFMASYTRRINRPRGWNLEPFLTWEDANNVRTGNPDLESEYVNSYEISYQTHIEDVILSFDTYYRERKNKIERVTSMYDQNVILTTFKNVGTDYTLGLEFMMNASLFKFWDFNLMGDLSDYKLEGVYEGRDYKRTNFNWSIRLNNSFAITSSTKFQINGMYRGPSVSAQGEFKGFYSTNVAIKQDLLNKKLAFTLQIRDIFKTAKREGTTTGFGFDSYVYSEMKSPMVMLNLTLNLNNYRQKRGGNMPSGMDVDDEGGEGEY